MGGLFLDSILFYWSTRLFFFRYRMVFVNVPLQEASESGSRSPWTSCFGLSSFLKDALANPVPWLFHIHLRVSVSISINKPDERVTHPRSHREWALEPAYPPIVFDKSKFTIWPHRMTLLWQKIWGRVWPKIRHSGSQYIGEKTDPVFSHRAPALPFQGRQGNRIFPGTNHTVWEAQVKPSISWSHDSSFHNKPLSCLQVYLSKLLSRFPDEHPQSPWGRKPGSEPPDLAPRPPPLPVPVLAALSSARGGDGSGQSPLPVPGWASYLYPLPKLISASLSPH